jgi:hypothetical protein
LIEGLCIEGTCWVRVFAWFHPLSFPSIACTFFSRALVRRIAAFVIEDMKARLGSHFMPHHTQMLTVQLFLQSAALHGGTPGNVISQVRSAIKKLRIVRLGFGTS